MTAANVDLSTDSRLSAQSSTKAVLLVIFTGLFLCVCYFIWLSWPTIIINSMQWQKEINNQLSELLFSAKNDNVFAGISLIGLSFLYGMLHSLGPGHGKLIVTTYIATHSTKVRLSVILTLLSAIMQACVAVALVSALLVLFNSSMREVNSKAELLITLSFYTVVLLGLVIVWRNLFALWQSDRRQKRDIKKVKHVKKVEQLKQQNVTTSGIIAGVAPLTHASATIQYQLSAFRPQVIPNDKLQTADMAAKACGCGHQHLVDSAQINTASSLKEYLVIVLSIGIRPCTGAIMVLLFANMLDIYWLGIISAFVMALGTALTTSVIAIMTITGRQLVKRYLTKRETICEQGSQGQTQSGHVVSSFSLGKFALQMLGGVMLILMGVILLSSQPVGMAPMF
jgi:nickel/cobalt exporter